MFFACSHPDDKEVNCGDEGSPLSCKHVKISHAFQSNGNHPHWTIEDNHIEEAESLKVFESNAIALIEVGHVLAFGVNLWIIFECFFQQR